MSANHRVLKVFRTIHLYLGVLMAPALLFFAITGGLQTFSLHETTKGSSYTPPAWLATVALLHKKQTIVAPVRRQRPAENAAPAGESHGNSAPAISAATHGTVSADSHGPLPSVGPPVDTARPKKNLLPMKIFFVLVSISLLLSTLTGIYMSYRYSRRPRLISGILLAGVVVPVLLLLF